MTERESKRIPFELLKMTEEGLERRGYFFLPVEREHTEALITGPLFQRLRTHIKKRGYGKVAGRVIVTFSGYEDDPREVYEVPEIRAFFRKLDSERADLPALLAYLPEFAFNGPCLYLMLLGEIDETINRPEIGAYDVHVVGAERLMRQAMTRIQRTSVTYGLSRNATDRLTAAFIAGATHRFPRPGANL